MEIAAIALLAVPLLVALDLVRRANCGTRVPLAVWLIPGTLAIDIAAVWTMARLGSGSFGGAALLEAARGSETILVGAAVLLLGEAAASGLAGPERRASRAVSREPAAVAGVIGGGLALLIGGLALGAGRVAAGLQRPLVWMSSGAIVATGIGAAGSLQRRTPSSYPMVPGVLAVTAMVVGAVADRHSEFVAAARSGIGVGFSWAPASAEVAFVAGCCAGVGAVVWLAIRRARKPWKWGTLGDIMLFVFVTVLFAAGLGGTLQRLQGAAGASATPDGPGARGSCCRPPTGRSTADGLPVPSGAEGSGAPTPRRPYVRNDDSCVHSTACGWWKRRGDSAMMTEVARRVAALPDDGVRR